VLRLFEIEADHDLDVMRPSQALVTLSAAVLEGIDRVLALERPDAVLVQGDTTTTFAASLAAFYHRIPVGHVEAGLRTGNRYLPFPEEMNRTLTSRLASWHFAPTRRNAETLRSEGIPAADVHVTGNTVIDALQWVVARYGLDQVPSNSRRTILVTIHRRESWGARLESACRAIEEILAQRPAVHVVLPVHLNPAVRTTVEGVLGNHPRVELTEPLEYGAFVRRLVACDLVLTDSGGVQEEAPALGKPVLVLRSETERQEAIDAGTALLVGTDPGVIVRETLRLLDEPAAYEAMARAVNPYGDGRASQRIVDLLIERLQGRTTPPQPSARTV
jgi:UDP-N-acetylglucosamine 2-epimerase (non-hydrolysing)